LPSDDFSFGVLVLATIVIVARPNYFPVLALGPVFEFLQILR
jgi:K+-transporting ATPase A subunit